MNQRFVLLSLLILALAAFFFILPYGTATIERSVDISEVFGRIENVTSDTVMLKETTVVLNNRYEPTGVLFLQLRAYDKESGNIVTENTSSLGPLGPGESGPVSQRIILARNGSYRLIYSVFENGKVVGQMVNPRADERMIITTPRESGLSISGYGYEYRQPDHSSSDILVRIKITNYGRFTSEPAALEVRAREEDRKVIVDRKNVEIPQIPPDQTRNFDVSLVVNDKNNYLVQMLISRNGTLIAQDDMDCWLRPGFFGDNATQPVVQQV
jgi:hypothetical protein